MPRPPRSSKRAVFPWIEKHVEAFTLVVAMSLISGLAQFWIRVRSGLHFSIMAMIGEVCISFSSACICGVLLVDHAPLGVTVGCAGVAGHMGARFVGLLDKAITDRARAMVSPPGPPLQ